MNRNGGISDLFTLDKVVKAKLGVHGLHLADDESFREMYGVRVVPRGSVRWAGGRIDGAR